MGDRRCRSEGIKEDSAPDVETLPISSWLKRAMQLTLPSRRLKLEDEAYVEMASTAQNLQLFAVRYVTYENQATHEQTWLSIRGLNMNSLLTPPKTEGWVSYKCLRKNQESTRSRELRNAQFKIMDLFRRN